MFNVDSSQGLKFLTRVRIGLSHLADHKFTHNFQDYVNPICSCGQEIKTPTHFLLTVYHCARQTLFEKVNKIDSTILRILTGKKYHQIKLEKKYEFTKSTSMGIWVVGTSNQLFIRGS